MKYDINDIMKILPHRYPFLLVDRIESINEDKTVCVAIKNVTANEPQYDPCIKAAIQARTVAQPRIERDVAPYR